MFANLSAFQQALLISGGIAASVMAAQLGRREFTAAGLVRPFAICGVVGYFYLRHAPTDGGALGVYAAAVVVGLVFAVLATVTTRMETNAGQVFTRCGVGFVLTWVAAVAARLVFIWNAEHNAGFRDHLGQFMMAHQIRIEAIAPFFVIWALTMVAGRALVLLARARRLAPVTPVTAAVTV